MAHINETCGGAERKAALCSLLEQEAQLIASIGRHKVVADEENKDSEAVRFLNKVTDISFPPLGHIIIASAYRQQHLNAGLHLMGK